MAEQAPLDDSGMAQTLSTYSGGCHCRAVRFECEAPRHLVCFDCNCSICAMKRNTHFVVPSSRFRLISGDGLRTYTFNTHVAQHKFCGTCGICSFYIPRSNPDGFAITVHCLDPPSFPYTTEIRHFDGINWEASLAGAGIQEHSRTDTAS